MRTTFINFCFCTISKEDQIKVFKDIEFNENIYKTILFLFKEDKRARGHKVILVKEQCQLDIRKYLFSEDKQLIEQQINYRLCK